MARKARVKSSTGMYHIIVRGFEMRAVFAELAAKEKILEIIEEYKNVCGYRVLGYVVLDNHLHLLLKEGPIAVGSVMKRVGVKFAAWTHARYAQAGRVFHDRFKSEPVENDESLLSVLRCLHQEPVRLGLATEVSRYAWSSFSAYMENSLLVDTQDCLHLFGAEERKQKVAFQKFMNEPSEDRGMEAVRKTVADAALKALLLRLAGVKTIDMLRKMPKAARNETLREAKAMEGVSTWQLARVSGLSQSVITRL